MFQYLTLYNNSFKVFTCSCSQFYKSQQLTALLQSCLVLMHFSQRTRTTYVTSILQLRIHCHTWIRGHHRSCHRLYITSKLQLWIPLPRNIAVHLRASSEKTALFRQNLESPAAIFWRESAVHDNMQFWAGFLEINIFVNKALFGRLFWGRPDLLNGTQFLPYY